MRLGVESTEGQIADLWVCVVFKCINLGDGDMNGLVAEVRLEGGEVNQSDEDEGYSGEVECARNKQAFDTIIPHSVIITNSDDINIVCMDSDDVEMSEITKHELDKNFGDVVFSDFNVYPQNNPEQIDKEVLVAKTTNSTMMA